MHGVRHAAIGVCAIAPQALPSSMRHVLCIGALELEPVELGGQVRVELVQRLHRVHRPAASRGPAAGALRSLLHREEAAVGGSVQLGWV